MHGNDDSRFQEIAGVGGLARAHREVIADGQHYDFGRVELADDPHIAEDVCVSGMIDLQAIVEFDDVAAGLAAVDYLVAILNAAGVIGVHHGDFDVANLLRAAFVHHGGLPGAFFLQPAAHFGHADDLRIVLLDDFDGVADVVAVAVRDQQRIDSLYLFLGRRAHRVVHDPGIDNDGLA